ncbi:hypothetical protein HR060_10490 [Catenovulum sp. SM1970]|uniref:hypothetical protein n=1 Tax=Marinifaba aquimaris TaxID=2741323 RepID=UPI00157462F9|nr:hypothetical protein [Marinifaba aquimaris]NTS77292.1 hypothetical protein [Marinifaba aquimaris]
MNWHLTLTGMKPSLGKYKAIFLLPILLAGTFFFSFVLENLHTPVVISEFIHIGAMLTLCAICAWVMILGVLASTKSSASALLVLFAYLIAMLWWLF